VFGLRFVSYSVVVLERFVKFLPCLQELGFFIVSELLDGHEVDMAPSVVVVDHFVDCCSAVVVLP